MKHEITELRLENGLRIYHLPVQSEDISIIANTNAGSLYEKHSQAGISHFVEHMLFKGTGKRASRGKIYNEMGLLGGNDFCYTNNCSVPLGMRVVLADFERALELMSDLLFYSRMDAKEIIKEKEIILDEIRNRADDPYVHLWDCFYEALFKGSKLAHPVGGFTKVIEQMTVEEVQDFYKKAFNPANVNVFTAGPLAPNEILEYVSKYFHSKNPGNALSLPKIWVPRNEKREKLIVKDLDNRHLMMGRIVPKITHKDAYTLNILASALSRSVSDKILNEEPLSYNCRVSYSANRFSGQLTAYATCSGKNYERVVELIRGEFEKYSKGQIPEDYVLDAINKKKKAFILGNSTTMEKAKHMFSFWLNYRDINEFNRHIEHLESVTPDKVRKAAQKYISLNDLTRVTIGNR